MFCFLPFFLLFNISSNLKPCLLHLRGKNCSTKLSRTLKCWTTQVRGWCRDKLAPGVAAAAFQVTSPRHVADNVDHWRCDTEDTEECDKITKLASRALQTLFLFSSVELGLDEEDVYTRAAWMKFCEKLDWNECGLASCNIKFKTRNNAQGLGRERASPRPPR